VKSSSFVRAGSQTHSTKSWGSLISRKHNQQEAVLSIRHLIYAFWRIAAVADPNY
jgi:hypothetical protein